MQGSTSFETITSYLPEKLRRLIMNIPCDKLSGLMELRPREIRSAIPVESGTVMITMINVFLTACRK